MCGAFRALAERPGAHTTTLCRCASYWPSIVNVRLLLHPHLVTTLLPTARLIWVQVQSTPICRNFSCHSAALVHMTREIALDWAPPHIPTSFYWVTWSTVTLCIYYNFAQLSKLSTRQICYLYAMDTAYWRARILRLSR